MCTEVGIVYCHVLEILAVIGSLRPNPLGLGSAVIAVQPTQVQVCNCGKGRVQRQISLFLLISSCLRIKLCQLLLKTGPNKVM